ncbi:hypothetical protein AVEN_66839-1 [Araneus ventricosus]|uniref:Uncharacterized protein n=1 Tax=Araneus ventricosus TaxID=182803 RepID=A0A4Y2DNY0_ARAVE|nr:hypothetical protein AVEN_66839-1 [Araneus ventricosus]
MSWPNLESLEDCRRWNSNSRAVPTARASLKKRSARVNGCTDAVTIPLFFHVRAIYRHSAGSDSALTSPRATSGLPISDDGTTNASISKPFISLEEVVT